MTESVLVAEHPAGDRVIGQLTLNVEKTLNSLTREMVDVITDRLEAWADDANRGRRWSSMVRARRHFVRGRRTSPAQFLRRNAPVAPVSTPSIFLLASTV